MMSAVAIVLHLFFGITERVALSGGAVGLGLVVWRLRVQSIERTFGLAGLTMIVFAVAAWTLHPDWGAAAAGLIPRLPGHGNKDVLLAAYFAVGIFSALLMAYEVHFVPEKGIVATTGILLGSLLTGALLVLAALVFFPRGIFPDLLSTTALPVALPLGLVGLRVALVGLLACAAGAAVETAMSAGYSVCQFYSLESNKDVPPEEVPVFTRTWVATLAIALFVALTGIKPLTLVSFAIMFGMVLMPLRFYPILKAAGDRELLGWLCFGIIVIAALAAVPLMILTHGGQP